MDDTVKREEISRLIREGRALYADWMAKVELVVNGVYKPEDLKPVSYTHSEFGKLFQSFSSEFHKLPTYKAIVTPLEGLHDMYVEIYKELTVKKPFFTGKEKWEQLQIEKASDVYNRMKEVSNTLYDSIDRFLREYSV